MIPESHSLLGVRVRQKSLFEILANDSGLDSKRVTEYWPVQCLPHKSRCRHQWGVYGGLVGQALVLMLAALDYQLDA